MRVINGQILKKLLISGANNLYNHYPEIDALNVFPVPDGDTGINMNLTLSSGSEEIFNRNDEDIYSIAKTFSRGLLIGARGNSGVITSQIFRGISDSLKDKTEANAIDLAYAFDNGRKVAYKAVIKPVEGTILTVIRESSSMLLDKVNEKTTIEEALYILYKEAERSLDRTPNLLPVLKEVGVVDSGGAGLVRIIEGIYSAACGEFINKNDVSVVNEKNSENNELDDVVYNYSLEFVLKIGPENTKKTFQKNRFISILNSHCEDVKFEEIQPKVISVKCNTSKIGSVISYCQNYGEFSKIEINPLSKKDEEKVEEIIEIVDDVDNHEEINEPLKEKAIIAVSVGEGINSYFKELGADYIVSGGQSMNPSTEDFIKAIKQCNAKNVYILPNNSNIILAATQAKDVLSDDYNIEVIPTKTITQGLLACMSYTQGLDNKLNLDNMMEAITSIKSGSVTFSIKDTDINGIHINKNEFIAIRESKKIIKACLNKVEALFALLDEMIDGLSSIVTLLIGQDVSGEEEVNLRNKLKEKYGYLDFEIRRGEQPIYSFYVGVE